MSIENQVITFYVDKQLLCMPLANVERVVKVMSLQQVPGMPSCFKGVMDRQGTRVPVIDLGELLSLSEADYHLSTPLIVCEKAGQFIGIIVDSVIGVSDINLNDIQMGKTLQNTLVEVLKGCVQTQEGAALFLDLDALLNMDFGALSQAKQVV